MDLEFLSEYFIPIVLAACLIIGYVIKKSLDFIPNKYIPLILVVCGSLLACAAADTIAFDTIVYGAFTGLASTGLHQAFTKIIESEK